MLPQREVYWNIGPEHFLLYPIAFLVVASLIYAVYRQYILLRKAQPENRFDRPWERLKGLVLYGVGTGRVLKEVYPGVMHSLIYGGMVVLFIGTVLNSADHYLPPFLYGTTYLVFSLAMDIASFAVITGLALAFYRRYVQKPDRLDKISDDWITLILLTGIVMSGLLVEGLRIGADELTAHPDWSLWSPLGSVFALAINGIGITQRGQLILHSLLWWTHMLLALGWIAYIMYSKLNHIFIAPFNIYCRNLKPGVALTKIQDWEAAETVGAAKIDDFTWKQLLDLNACVRCGRCQDNCPAYLTGKPLSPKKLIQNLKNQMDDISVIRKQENKAEDVVPIIGNALKEEELWACTTCAACQEMCPVFIEHISKTTDIRRNLVMMDSQMPEHFQAVITNLERMGHAWAGTQHTRTDWIDELGLKTLQPGEQVELLYWVGCTGALESLSRKITFATAKLLRDAGVNFGLLGNEEICCGDPARRIGNEYLFQTMAEQNIGTFRSHGVKRILTHCPHCLNTLKNEYPEFGGDFEVIHHSQLLAELMQQGRLSPSKAIDDKVVLHDSCYLGRHNDIYAAPREILKKIPGITLVEMERARERSFCCGGGGGHMWAEDNTGRRLNDVRIEQAEATGANTLAVACPFCLQMFQASITATNRSATLRVCDISELLRTN